MFSGMYMGYLIMALGLAIIGVVYGIRLQMRQNFGRKMAKLDTAGHYSHWVDVLGEPTKVDTITTEDGECYKSVVWAVPGATVKARFNEKGYCVNLEGLSASI